jgi:hypothetical protein
MYIFLVQMRVQIGEGKREGGLGKREGGLDSKRRTEERRRGRAKERRVMNRRPKKRKILLRNGGAEDVIRTGVQLAEKREGGRQEARQRKKYRQSL